ncbi:MAG TPA: hypothetical protein VGF67_30045 [Ktedonobacteraceae bacterium]|jgi:hypothetical protein
MRQGQHFAQRGRANVALVDLNAAPAGSPQMAGSQANISWNEHTLLRPEVTAYAGSQALQEHLEAVRSIERQEIEQNPAHLLGIVGAYASWSGSQGARQPPRECLATRLAGLYPSCMLACGGCSACRAQGLPPSAGPLLAEIEPELLVQIDPVLCYELRQLPGSQARLNVFWDGGEHALKHPLAHLLAGLVWAGIQQLLLPEELASDQPWIHQLLHELAARRTMAHQLVAHPLLHLALSTLRPAHGRGLSRRRTRRRLRPPAAARTGPGVACPGGSLDLNRRAFTLS